MGKNLALKIDFKAEAEKSRKGYISHGVNGREVVLVHPVSDEGEFNSGVGDVVRELKSEGFSENTSGLRRAFPLVFERPSAEELYDASSLASRNGFNYLPPIGDEVEPENVIQLF